MRVLVIGATGSIGHSDIERVGIPGERFVRVKTRNPAQLFGKCLGG